MLRLLAIFSLFCFCFTIFTERQTQEYTHIKVRNHANEYFVHPHDYQTEFIKSVSSKHRIPVMTTYYGYSYKNKLNVSW